MRFSQLSIVVVGLAGCANPAPKSNADTASVRASLDSLDQKVQHWIDINATDSIVSGYYAPDAVFMSSNGPSATGTEAIRAAYNVVLSSGLVRVRFHAASMRVADSVASTQGTYALVVHPKPPADTTQVEFSDHGSYVTTFIRRDGKWRALYDAATSEVPLPTPAPPKKKKGRTD